MRFTSTILNILIRRDQREVKALLCLWGKEKY